MRLSEALADFMLATAGELSPETQRWYRHRIESLVKYLADPPLDEIAPRDLWRWRAYLLGQDGVPCYPYAPSTVNGFIRAIRRFFGWLLHVGLLEANPARELKFVREPDQDPKAISDEDFLKLLEAARENARDYAIIAFLGDTGCRAGGLVSLTLERLDLDGMYAIVEEKHRGGSRTRVVYFSEFTRDALQRWLEVRPNVENDYVFLSVRGTPLTVSGLYQMLERRAKRAGVKGRFNPHAFRHAFARTLLKQGASLDTVSKLMGHSSVEVTSRFYARWAQNELAEMHRRYSPLNHLHEKTGEHGKP